MKQLLKKIIISVITTQAGWVIRRHKPTIIAITGSVGKTSTKDAIYDAIKKSVHARKSQKSFNSEFGVPLTVLGLRNGWNNPWQWVWNIVDGTCTALFSRTFPDVLVLETGVDTPGDMKQLTNWLTPDIVVLTRLPDVPTHVEQFASPQAIVEEKMTLIHRMSPNGTVIYNADDATIVREMEKVTQVKLSYSQHVPATIRATAVSTTYLEGTATGTNITLRGADEKELQVTTPEVIGNQSAYCLAAALTVASVLQVDTADAIASLETMTLTPGRMRLLDGIKRTHIIDDTYNASPAAVSNALQTLSETTCAGRKFAVLGDMLELGSYSIAAHQEIGKEAAAACDFLITVGVRARHIAQTAQQHGLDGKHIFQYEHTDRTGKELQNMLQPGDLILVKGSQGMRMEKVVLEIMNEPMRADELLVRQDTAWRKR